MTELALARPAEDLGRHGLWRFTRQYQVEPAMTRAFYELYEAAFGPLRTRAMARQVLTEAEFAGQMVDDAVVKYVAWDDADHPVGLCTMTRQLSRIPWISPEYFAHRYPEQWERNAVWYFGFVLAHPSQRHSRFLDQMVEIGVREPLADRAICGYDMCAHNVDVLPLGQRLAEAFQRVTGAAPERGDGQYYYTLDFTRGAPESGTAPGLASSAPSGSSHLHASRTPRTVGTV